MILGFALMSAPTPAGLTHEGQIVLVMSLMATMLFITEAIPLPTVPLLIIVGEVVLLGVDSTKVAQSLMTDSVLFIMGSLMLAVAIVKQRLDKRIAWWIVRMTGTNVYWISFGITTVCGVLAAFIGEHTVAAMMLPVGVTLITLTSNDPKKVHNLAAVILFSISYGCSIAGVATPSGGARNAIIISYWKDFFYNPLDPETYRFLMDYVTWIIYAFPMFLLRLPIVTALLIYTFKPEVTDMSRAISRLRTQVSMQGPMRGLGLADHPDLRPHHPGLGHAVEHAGSGRHRHRRRSGLPGLRPGALGGHQLRRQLGRGAALCGGDLARCRDEGDGCRRMGGGTASSTSCDESGAGSALRLQRGDLAADHRRLEHHDGGCRRGRAGPDRAQDGRRRRRGSDQRRLRHRHLLGLRLSDAGGAAGLHHHLCLGLISRAPTSSRSASA